MSLAAGRCPAAWWRQQRGHMGPARGVASAGGCHVIAADLRGHGASSRTPAYPLAGFRDDAIGLLDALALDEFSLAGHSLGGYVASLIAQRQPGRVTRLVLEEPPAPARGPAEAHGLSPARLLLPALGALGRHRGFDHKAVTSAVRQLRVPDPAWWDRLTSITAPTLLITGGRRSHVPPQQLAEAARKIPDCPAGHHPGRPPRAQPQPGPVPHRRRPVPDRRQVSMTTGSSF